MWGSFATIFALIKRLYSWIKVQIAPTWFSNFLEKESGFLTSRETRCLNVLLNLSESEAALDAVAQKWDETYPAISQIWIQH